ncbi:MAG TPA: hypothetical protein VIL01_12125 [Thermomicrobiales bacterium]
MSEYRDPDDRPVDPIMDDESSERPPRRSLPPLTRPTDPDAFRPARIGDDDGLAIDPDEPRRRYTP